MGKRGKNDLYDSMVKKWVLKNSYMMLNLSSLGESGENDYKI